MSSAQHDPLRRTTEEAARPTEQARIQADIEQTREHLADTIDSLAHKADISARTKEKARHGGDVAREKAEEAKQAARENSEKARQVAREKTEETRQKVRAAADQGLSKLPPPAAERVEQAAEVARRNPIPAVITGVAAFLIVRRVLTRKR